LSLPAIGTATIRGLAYRAHTSAKTSVQRRFLLWKRRASILTAEFEGIVKKSLQSKPMKRDKVKVAKKKPAKLIPPQK
jgi:hypothetical protein